MQGPGEKEADVWAAGWAQVPDGHEGGVWSLYLGLWRCVAPHKWCYSLDLERPSQDEGRVSRLASW